MLIVKVSTFTIRIVPKTSTFNFSNFKVQLPFYLSKDWTENHDH